MNKTNKSYDFLILIAMIYVAVDLSSMVFAYKIIEIGPLIGAASSLIFPLTYSIMDIIAEVYGHKMAKKIIWFAFACDFIFAILVLGVSQIPSSNQTETITYMHIFSPLLRAVIAQMIGVLAGAFINIYLISKWKVLVNGRYFWLRSIGSSTIGEAVMLVISVFIALVGVLPLNQLIQLIMYTYCYKIIFAFVAAPFISFAATLLKNKIDGWNSDIINLSSLNIQNR